MKKFFAKNSGFNLPELMIVITIIAIISVMAAANLRDGRHRIALDNQAAEFAQDLRQAQEWALSLRGWPAAAGYGVYIENDGLNKYILYADLNNNKVYDVGDAVQKTVSLNEAIEIAALNPDPIDINYLAAESAMAIINGGGAQTLEAVFRVKNAPTMTRAVAANVAGLVYVEQ